MNLIIRADANSRIGTGHLMRCLALAQGWKAAGGAATFVTNCESAQLRGRLKDEGFAVVEIEESYPHSSDAAATRKVLENYSQSWCVIDGYHFDQNFHREMRRGGSRVLVVDDTAHLPFYDADAILNQNINADQLRYERPKDATLLLGTSYALLRNEFTNRLGWRREIPAVARKILITMGGSDFLNQTAKAVRAAQNTNVENLEVKAVVGASNPHLAELRKAVAASRVRIELIVGADNMAELMAWADAAIAAAGSTCWELAFLGLPSVLIAWAENQIGLARGLGESGFAENLGWFEQVSENALTEKLNEILPDAPRRARMSIIGNEIVDGRGAERVIEILRRK